MEGTDPVSRPAKLSHLDTILYEIDMLEYCYGRLRISAFTEQMEYFLPVEGFLLHYRNLIQFFGNDHDLKAGTPEVWSPRALTDHEVRSIQDRKPFKRHNGQISQYLSHCTQSRSDRDRSWEHVAMYKEIEELLKRFRELFPASKNTTRVSAVLEIEGMSTTTTSHYQIFDPEVFGPRIEDPKPKKED